MEVLCSGPFRVGSFLWQPRPGVFTQTVVCKVTFTLAPGISGVAPAAAEVVAFDEHAGEGERRTLVQATDFVPFKARPEVTVTGCAYAPANHPVPFLRARLAVGDVDKSIAVHGDRSLWSDGVPPEAAPFVKMPLTWDRAAGGPDTSNPAGIPTGAAAQPDVWGRVRLPNLLPPGGLPPSGNEPIAPIGFGPISPSWPSRRARLQRYAASWDPLRWAERPLPSDLDGTYFQAAPADQILSELRPDESIVLESLHPQFPLLTTRLFRVVPVAAVETRSASTPLRLRCDTLIIDTDRGLATLVYRGQVSLDHPQQTGRVVVSPEPAATPPSQTRLAPAAGAAPSFASARAALPAPPDEALATVVLSGTPEGTAAEPPLAELEAMIAANPELSALPREEALRVALRMARLFGGGPPSKQTVVAPIAPAKPVLPFGGADSDSRPPSPATVLQPELDPESAVRSAVHPFASGESPATREAVSARAPSSAEQAPASDTSALPFRPHFAATVGGSALGRSMRLQPVPPAAPAPSTPRFDAPPPPDIAVPDTDIPPPPDGAVVLPDTRWPVALPAAQVPFVAPPAPFSLSPLDTPPSPPLSPAPPETPPLAPDAAPPPTPAEPEPTPEEPLPLADYPLGRCARIAASAALRPSEQTAILGKEALGLPLWDRLQAHWAETLAAEQRRGKSDHTRAYDTAYVAQLETERGPLTITDYARITVAVERREAPQILDDLHLTEATLPHLQRHWIHRLVTDPTFAKQARAALRAARDSH